MIEDDRSSFLGAALSEGGDTGSHRGRWIALAVLTGVVALLAGVYGVDLLLSRDRVDRGVTVAGVEIGGTSRTTASRLLTAGLATRATGPVRAVADGVPVTIDPVEAGLGVDVDRTLDQATSRTLNPWTRLRSFFAAVEVEPVTLADDAALRIELSRQAVSIDRDRQEGTVTYRGLVPTPVLPRAGRELDVEGAATALRTGYLRTSDPVELPVRELSTTVTPEAVQVTLTTLARTAVSSPVVLRGSGRQVIVPATTIAATLQFAPDGRGGLVPRLDGDRLVTALAPVLRTALVPARDARFDLRSGKPVLVPSVTGATADPDALASAVLPALRRPAPRIVALPVVIVQPKLSTAQAQALGIREVIGEFTTRHACCAGRVTNIHKMADIVRGTLVRPGETFSLNGRVGQRDAARGFVKAPMILDGQFVDAVGGGVSQFATTMFNAVFFSGLEDVQHQAHSYYISRYPAGREATVSFPEPDLRWRNDSPHGVLVDTSYTDRSITVRFWGTKRYDVESVSGSRTRIRPFGVEYVQRDDCTAAPGAEGFDIVVTRIFRQKAAVVKRESFRTRYVPEPNFICGPPPAAVPPSASPSPSPTPSPMP